MKNEDGSVTVVFNGEIYNFQELREELIGDGHVFRSRSDTEVLLFGYVQWGVAGLLARLNGMFAFAVWDKGTQRLVIARDRLGEKPLYYTWNGKTLVFSSELKALLASGLVERRLNPAATMAFLTFGSVPDPLTMIEGVVALPPGHFLVLEDAQVRVEPYWRLEFIEDQRIGVTEAAEKVSALLCESVRARLVSDVPVGIFLSGGIDSGVLLALAREVTSGELRTYSIAFDEGEYSEARFAEAVARKFHSEHVTQEVTAAELKSELPKIVSAMDQPSVDGVNTYFVSKLTRESGTVVALSGIGGDELFGGYSTFRSVPRLSRLSRRLGFLMSVAANLVSSAAGPLHRSSLSRLRDFAKAPRSLEAAYLAMRGLFPTEAATQILAPGFQTADSAGFDPLACFESSTYCANRSVENQVSGLEMRGYLRNQLLRDTNVMAMTHSLEVRAPFLDYRLMDFVASVPASIKFATPPKSLMLRAVGDRLPGEILTGRKHGFLFPFERWLKGVLKHDVEQILNDEDGGQYFRRERTLSLWRDFLHGRVHWSRVWAVVTLKLWIEHTLFEAPPAMAAS